jgi:hypothetical protein
MTRTLSHLATCTAAAALIVALGSRSVLVQAHATSKEPTPCSLITPDQIKTLIDTPVVLGKPGSADSHDCTWADSKGVTRVYVSLKDADGFKDLRTSMQATGRLLPITGLAEDAFFVSSVSSSTALYALKAKRLLLLTVDGAGFSKAQNQAAEKALAAQILAKL